jgi:hypothetical protein
MLCTRQSEHYFRPREVEPDANVKFSCPGHSSGALDHQVYGSYGLANPMSFGGFQEIADGELPRSAVVAKDDVAINIRWRNC